MAACTLQIVGTPRDVMVLTRQLRDRLGEVSEVYRAIAGAVTNEAPGWRGEARDRFLSLMDDYGVKARRIQARAEELCTAADRVLALYEAGNDYVGGTRGLDG